MKALLITGLLFMAFQGFSMEQPADTSARKFFKQFTFQLNWGEMGSIWALNQRKMSQLGSGLNRYYSRPNLGTHGGIPGFTFYYKDKIGLGFMLTGNEFMNRKMNYLNYLAAAYPDYYIPENPHDYAYRSAGVSISASYKKYLNHFILEPKIRASIGTLSPDNQTIWMKEGGTNQFKIIEIAEERNHYLNSYHAILALIYEFDNLRLPFKWQIGAQADFFVSPMKSNTTVSEYYSGTNTKSSVTYDTSRWNPALGITFFANWKFGR